MVSQREGDPGGVTFVGVNLPFGLTARKFISDVIVKITGDRVRNVAQ